MYPLRASYAGALQGLYGTPDETAAYIRAKQDAWGGVKKASLESAIPIPHASAQRRPRLSVLATHQACGSAGGTVLRASRSSRMISVQSSTQLSQMYTPFGAAISRSTCFCSLPQKEQWYSVAPVRAPPIAFSLQRIVFLPMPRDSTAMTYLRRLRCRGLVTHGTERGKQNIDPLTFDHVLAGADRLIAQ